MKFHRVGTYLPLRLQLRGPTQSAFSLPDVSRQVRSSLRPSAQGTIMMLPSDKSGSVSNLHYVIIMTLLSEKSGSVSISHIRFWMQKTYI